VLQANKMRGRNFLEKFRDDIIDGASDLPEVVEQR
jgi:hypothetical protein